MANPYHDEIGRFTDAENAAFRMADALLTQKSRDELAAQLEAQGQERLFPPIDSLAGEYPPTVPFTEVEDHPSKDVGAFEMDRDKLALVRTTAENMGFDPDKIEIMTRIPMLNIGGQISVGQAVYDTRDGKIRIAPHLLEGGSDGTMNNPDDPTGGLAQLHQTLRHEITHDAWHQVLTADASNPPGEDALKPAAGREIAQFQNSIREAWLDDEMRATLEDEDGVSDYSSMYWEDYRDAPPEYRIKAYDAALNETLAEISSFEGVDDEGFAAPRPGIMRTELMRLHRELLDAYSFLGPAWLLETPDGWQSVP